ncbi:MAG TPA: hypothetical protein VJJ75_01235 [Candidatus Nanoarchaeia archaeon]|nr:hypothetical protein [Candidatus Nanoarchaeia archaeon]
MTTTEKKLTDEEITTILSDMAQESRKPNRIGKLRVKDAVLEATVTEKGRYELVKRLFYDENTGKIARAPLYLLHRENPDLPPRDRYISLGRAREFFDENDKLPCKDKEKLNRLGMNLVTQREAKAIYDFLRVHKY